MEIKLATTLEEQCRWAAQWREAAIALEEVKRYELATLTEDEALKASDMLLDLARQYAKTFPTSGLIEQQARFHEKTR